MIALRIAALAVILTLSGGIVARAQPPAAPAAAPADERLDELERQIEALRAEIAALEASRGTGGGAGDGDQLVELERRIDLLAAELERLQLGEAAARADRSQYGMGPAASKVYRVAEGLSLGGYGEMIYQGIASERDDGVAAGRKDRLDFLRGIVYVGYKFDDKWLFNSEIEFEHASTGKSGEASVEFAYLDYLWRPELGFRTGLLLVPMGFVNELHEPVVFLGANRPATERVIIPSTWRENGLGLFGEAGDLTYRAYLVNGFDAAGFSAGGLRGGRQKGSEALAEDFALVGRVDYAPTPGVLVGGSVYQGDSGQGLADPAGGTLEVSTRIFELHGELGWRALHLRALAAWAELDDVAGLNRARGLTGSASVGEELQGWYLEAGYDVLSRFAGGRAALTPFVRWEQLNTQRAVPAGFAASGASDQEILTLGLDFKPIPNVVFKADWQDVDHAAGTGIDQWNLGMGYVF
ncbi:MAG TPA: ABC transporter C-terminal domain-containing protein [Thermoanaerobaculia bacterium]|nr:ABC transporter C-terminal domain-containing protein [Thermoanaerobaculia bacterium]